MCSASSTTTRSKSAMMRDLRHEALRGCERIPHIMNYIFAQAYLPCNVRSLMPLKGARKRHIKESARIGEVLYFREVFARTAKVRYVFPNLRPFHPPLWSYPWQERPHPPIQYMGRIGGEIIRLRSGTTRGSARAADKATVLIRQARIICMHRQHE